MKKILIIAMLAIGMTGCTSAEWSKVGALGGSQHVTLYTLDGKVLGQWDSDGTVHNEENSEGLYFTDKATGKLVRVSGTYVVTQN